VYPEPKQQVAKGRFLSRANTYGLEFPVCRELVVQRLVHPGMQSKEAFLRSEARRHDIWKELLPGV